MNNKRVLIVILAVMLFFAGITIKLFNIQILRNEELKYLAERQQTKVEILKAERGLIFDRSNILLAYNRDDVSFFLDLRMAGKIERKKIAAKFSEVFGKPQKFYFDLMDDKGKTVCLEKKAPSEKAYLLKDFKAVGLFSLDDPTRVYPYNNLASHLLGYVSTEGQGIGGIERAFENSLHGNDGTMLIEKNAIGDMMTVEEGATQPADAGDNLVLTINKNYQGILEDELEKGLKEFGGAYAIGIIMDPNTGEVLALSNKKDYDPNTYWKFNDTIRRNKAFTDTYEPGSTFKTITMSALFDQQLCREDETVNIEHGHIKFNGVNINDSHNGPASLTVKGVLEQSSNVGMAKLSQRIDDELLFKYYRGFGFGNATGFGIPGEESGYLKKPTGWNNLTKAFMSFGYELSVTPIQLITAYSAVINGGTLYQPQIIKRRLSHNGVLMEENAPKPVRTVISKSTSLKMREFLRGVVEFGTAKNAKLNLVSCGGKTGTSQKLVNGSYSKSNYNSSFIGFFPVEDPKIICLIVVNSPERGKFGGLVAAPIFKNVADKIVSSDPGYFKQVKPETKPLPEIKNENTASATNNKMNVVPVVNKIKTYNPSENIQQGVMPDLSNYPVKEAIQILGRLGLKSQIDGSGIVSSQSIIPGERIKKGALCKLSCQNVNIKGTVVY